MRLCAHSVNGDDSSDTTNGLLSERSFMSGTVVSGSDNAVLTGDVTETTLSTKAVRPSSLLCSLTLSLFLGVSLLYLQAE